MPSKSKLHQPEAEAKKSARTKCVLDVLNNGSGDELLTLEELKLGGAHPFSNSTRRRKIKANEYPKPIQISSQMCVWKVREIRLWRQDPQAYKLYKKIGGQK